MTIKTFALLLALILSPAALAQVTVTIQATPDSDVLGFVTGNSYSFTITLPADSRPPYTRATSDSANWRDDYSAASPTVVTDLTGTGLSGVFTAAGLSSLAVEVSGTRGAVTIFQSPDGLYGMKVDSASGDGSLLTPDGSPFVYLAADFSLNQTLAILDGTTYTSPSVYLHTLVGPLDLNQGLLTLYSVDSTYSTAVARLAITSVSVASAVPEPSTYAAILGGLALGYVAWRRRRSMT